MKKTIIVLMALALSIGSADAQRKNSRSSSSKSKSSQSSKSKKRGRSSEEGKKFNISLGLSLVKSNSVAKELSDGTHTATITRSATAIGVFVYPKYHLVSNEKYSISVGIPLTLAFAASANVNSQTGGESSSSFAYDLPIMVDYNGGVMAPANRFAEGKFGYFVGAGIGIANATATEYQFVSNGYTGDYSGYDKVKSVGPCVHAGAVFRLGSEDHPRFFGVRIAYRIGLNSDKFNYLIPSIFINL